MKKTPAERLMTELRTELDNYMRSILSKTSVMRIVKCFPRSSNRQIKTLLCYDEYNQIIKIKNIPYIMREEIKNLLPKRIPIIEDICYLTKKDYDYMTSN